MAPLCLRWKVAVAIGLPLLALAAQWAIWSLIPPSPQLLFYPAVFFTARIAGARAGYAASALSLLAIAFVFLPPSPDLRIEDGREALDLLIFLVVAVAMSHTVGQLASRIAKERALKDAMKTTWSMVAHDLRSPLHTIQLGSDLIAHGDGARDSGVRHQAEIIERSSMRAARLVRDAVDAMSLGDGTLRVVPVACSVRELLARVADEAAVIAARAGIRLESTVITRRTTVFCDASRIAQVLTNLLANAFRFTPRGGTIAVTAEDDGDDVRITVRDTGAGISGEDLSRVFVKDWTTGGGHGLGLWIARTIVEAHARSLQVTSVRGQGAAFTFSLPAVAA